ncbi:hypothetical protein ACVXG8_00620 [Escherichia coli]
MPCCIRRLWTMRWGGAEVAANVVIDALIVGISSLLVTSVGITMGCTAVVLTGLWRVWRWCTPA